MLIAIVALAGLLSFGSVNVVKDTGNNQNQQERIISHTVGSIETVEPANQDKAQPEERPQVAPAGLPN
jgi:hypothetical protein